MVDLPHEHGDDREPRELDPVSIRLRDAFLHHLLPGDDDRPAGHDDGIRWRFIPTPTSAVAFFNLRAGPNGESTRVPWEPRLYPAPDATREAIERCVKKQWPTALRARNYRVPGEYAETVVWEHADGRWRSFRLSQDGMMARHPLRWLDAKGECAERRGQISCFVIALDDRCISLPCLALIQQHLPYHREPFQSISGSTRRSGQTMDLDMDFLFTFARHSGSGHSWLSDITPPPHFATTLRYQLRHFRPRRELPLGRLKEGLLADRQRASIRIGGENVSLVEHVSAAIMFAHGDGGRWGITVLLNDVGPSLKSLSETVSGMREWAIGRDSERFFRAVLLKLFSHAEDGWNETLDVIDSSAGVTLGDFSSDEGKDRLMFDRSFQRSRDYFTALQLLRLVDKWADDNVQALVSLAENWREKVRRQKASPEDVYLNERCFDDTIAEFKKRTAVIHKRVKVLREDITSLRDGLFNATSLREATRGTSLNMTLYLFTIVTIIYTPIGFLATFWAMPWLNNPANPEEHIARPQHLLSSFIAVPLLTYIIAGLFATYFWPSRPRGELIADLLVGAWRSPSALLHWTVDRLDKTRAVPAADDNDTDSSTDEERPFTPRAVRQTTQRTPRKTAGAAVGITPVQAAEPGMEMGGMATPVRPTPARPSAESAMERGEFPGRATEGTSGLRSISI